MRGAKQSATSPAQITHEKADGVLEKSLSNVHTPTIRRCGPLYQQRHCRLRAGWVTESLKQARGVMPGPRYWPANRMVSSPLLNETRKCGKLNEGLPPAGQSPSGALARNKHQILVHTLRTILHRCMRRGVVTKKKCPGL